MKREELQKILLEKGVHKNEFSVDGIKHYEALCLVHNKEGNWEIVYNSRGDIIKIALFYDEEEACDFMYEEMKKDYKF